MKLYINNRKIALATGTALVLMTIVAGIVMATFFAKAFTLSAEQLQTSLSTNNAFFAGILGWVVILICDVVVSWGLYAFYREKNKTTATWMGLLRLAYSGILAFGIVKLFNAYFAFNQATPNFDEVHAGLHAFQAIWQFGLIVFGFHLMLLAPLVCVKKNVLQIISALLFIAGIGYVLSNTANLVVTDYELYRAKVEAVFVLPMILGEFGLALWLVLKGVKPSISKAKQFAF